MTTNLAAPNGHKGSRVTVGAAPSQNVAIGSLDNGEDVTGALVGHFDQLTWEKKSYFIVRMWFL